MCEGCGKCCRKHWLLRLTNQYEIDLFEGQIVFGRFIWTDECRFLDGDKCSIHDDENRPLKCKEYSCEK
jgi:Fe-S-cluster containining protein